MIASVQTFAYKWIPTAKTRAVVSVVIFVACRYAAIGASTNFVGNLVDLVRALLVLARRPRADVAAVLLARDARQRVPSPADGRASAAVGGAVSRVPFAT